MPSLSYIILCYHFVFSKVLTRLYNSQSILMKIEDININYYIKYYNKAHYQSININYTI